MGDPEVLKEKAPIKLPGKVIAYTETTAVLEVHLYVMAGVGVWLYGPNADNRLTLVDVSRQITAFYKEHALQIDSVAMSVRPAFGGAQQCLCITIRHHKVFGGCDGSTVYLFDLENGNDLADFSETSNRYAGHVQAVSATIVGRTVESIWAVLAWH